VHVDSSKDSDLGPLSIGISHLDGMYTTVSILNYRG
jgi:hypothetical protein